MPSGYRTLCFAVAIMAIVGCIGSAAAAAASAGDLVFVAGSSTKLLLTSSSGKTKASVRLPNYDAVGSITDTALAGRLAFTASYKAGFSKSGAQSFITVTDLSQSEPKVVKSLRVPGFSGALAGCSLSVETTGGIVAAAAGSSKYALYAAVDCKAAAGSCKGEATRAYVLKYTYDAKAQKLTGPVKERYLTGSGGCTSTTSRGVQVKHLGLVQGVLYAVAERFSNTGTPNVLYRLAGSKVQSMGATSKPYIYGCDRGAAITGSTTFFGACADGAGGRNAVVKFSKERSARRVPPQWASAAERVRSPATLERASTPLYALLVSQVSPKLKTVVAADKSSLAAGFEKRFTVSGNYNSVHVVP